MQKKPANRKKSVTQTAKGDSNILSAGDYAIFNFNSPGPKRPKVIIERSPDHISPADQKRVSDWINDLAQESTGKPIGQLIAGWWKALYSRFSLTTYKELKTEQMPDAEAWYIQQKNLIKANRKTDDPESWRKGKIASIKSKMRKMGKTEEQYYLELSDRMNMKKPFQTLTKLSKHDLGRAEGMVKRDYEKWKSGSK